MRAIEIKSHGGPDVLQLVEVPVPDPGPTDVRVRHHAIGLNFIDTYQRSGLYPQPMPFIPGSEGAGVVEAVGAAVTEVKVGDRVTYVASTGGSYADQRLVPAAEIVKLPPTIELTIAAAALLKGLTVEFLLHRTQPQGGLHAGDTIVWHAAAGGVGLIAMQWAKALGLIVIGTAGGPEKCALAKRAGADHVVDYHREDVVARVKEITHGAGVKIVYDSVGKDTFERSLDCLAPFGLLVSFGNASGPPPALELRTLAAKGSLYVTRPTLYTHTKLHRAEMVAKLFEMIASKQIVIEVSQTYALAEAAQAHRDLEARKTTGATILVP